MEPRQYAAAVWHRCLWIGASGLAVAAAAVTAGMAAPATDTASRTSASARWTPGRGSPGALLVDDELLPSIVRLGTSPAVLARGGRRSAVDTDRGRTGRSRRHRAGPDTSVLVVTARAASASGAADLADAVAKTLSTVATAAHADADGASYLQADVVGPAREPRFPSGTSARTDALRGLAVGLLVGVLLSGLVELARPRIRDLATAAELTTSPVLAGLPAAGRRRSSGAREAGLDRLGWLLRSSPRSRNFADRSSWAPIPGRPAAARTTSGRYRGRAWYPCRCRRPGCGTPARPGTTGCVVVATGRTPPAASAPPVAAAEAAGVPVLGVVLDGASVLPRGGVTACSPRCAGDAPLPRRISAARASAGVRPPWLTAGRVAGR